MIKYILFAIFFAIMISKPEIFNQAKDEETRKKYNKYMRIFGIVGIVCVGAIVIMQLTGMA